MSAAYKCDGCGVLFEHSPTLAVGDVLLMPEGGEERRREIMDYCRDCAPRVLDALNLSADEWKP